MTNEDAFLQAIIDAPDDDGPRLIFADWLEEQGRQERADFIRVQCALAVLEEWARGQFLVLPESPEGQQVERLRQLQRELLTRPTLRDWFGGLWELPVERFRLSGAELFLHDADTGRGVIATAILSRGFVDRVSCRCADWLAHGPAIVRQQPVRTVRLSDKRMWKGHQFYYWSLNAEGAYGIPVELFYLLSNGEMEFVPGSRGYLAEEGAIAALSDACLLYARQQSPARVQS